MPRRARLSDSSVVVAGVVVAVATFGLGFVLAYDPGPGTDRSEVATVGSTVAPTTVAPTTAPSTTVASSTTLAPTTVVTTAPTTAPPPVPPGPAPSVELPPPPVPTQPPVTVPSTTTAAPGVLEVTYPRDGQGRMVLLAGGSGAVLLTNTGGTAVSFTVNVVGAATLGGSTSLSGQVAPGETRAVSVVAAAEAPGGVGPHASLSVFGALGMVAGIPVVIL